MRTFRQLLTSLAEGRIAGVPLGTRRTLGGPAPTERIPRALLTRAEKGRIHMESPCRTFPAGIPIQRGSLRTHAYLILDHLSALTGKAPTSRGAKTNLARRTG